MTTEAKELRQFQARIDEDHGAPAPPGERGASCEVGRTIPSSSSQRCRNCPRISDANRLRRDNALILLQTFTPDLMSWDFIPSNATEPVDPARSPGRV